MYDLSTSTETRITASESNQSEPAIYEDKIVWQDDRNGNWDIYMYDLSTSTETRITTNESNQRKPAIYGDKIMWVHEIVPYPSYPHESNNTIICMYNLSTSKETQLSHEAWIEKLSIYGNRIVWVEDYSGGDPLIVMYDLSTSKEILIAEPIAYDADIYEDRIVGKQTFLFDSGYIFMYNLSTSTKTELTTEGGSGYDPAIYGDRIVWIDGNNIYMFTLASAEAPGNNSSELTPLDDIQALKEYVECTCKCHEDIKTDLTTLLDRAKCFYEKGEDEKAICTLESFIQLVEKMKVCEQISADEADYMIMEAEKIIGQMDNGDGTDDETEVPDNESDNGAGNVTNEVCEETKPDCEQV